MDQPAAHANHRVIALIVASALLMQTLDNAVVATALPSMARDLGENLARLGAAITSYLVAFTVFIPFSSWIADRFGAKRVFMLAIIVFVLASALSGQARGLEDLIIFRILQGAGAAMIFPVGRLLLLRGVRKEELISAMAWLTMPAMLGPITGPPLGGILTDLFGWRAVFWINVPIGVIGLLLVAWKIPAIPPSNPGRPDVLGLTLVGLALALGMFGLETVGRQLVAQPWPWVSLMAGLLFGGAAYFHCRRAPRPAIDVALLEIPTFRQPALFGNLFRVGAGAVPFLVPIMLQLAFDMSASESGLISFAAALGAFIMKPLVRPLLQRFGFRNTLLINGVLASIGIALLALPNPSWPTAAIFFLLACGGLFRSLQFTSLNTLVFADVPPERLSAATSFYSTIQQISPALAVVLATATLETSRLIGGRAELALADFATGFLVAASVTLLSVPMLALLSRDAGVEVSGHDPGPRTP